LATLNIDIFEEVSSFCFYKKTPFERSFFVYVSVVIFWILCHTQNDNVYLFDRVGLFLAFFKPGFFLSLILGSLLSNQYGFNVNLNSEFRSINALENHSLIASA